MGNYICSQQFLGDVSLMMTGQGSDILFCFILFFFILPNVFDSVGPHCCGQHPHSSLMTEKLSWYLHGVFTSLDVLVLFGARSYSAGYRKETPTPTPAQKPPPTNCPADKMWWNNGSQPINVWLNLRPMSPERTWPALIECPSLAILLWMKERTLDWLLHITYFFLGLTWIFSGMIFWCALSCGRLFPSLSHHYLTIVPYVVLRSLDLSSIHITMFFWCYSDLGYG